jgi:hypothetical protein
MLSFATEFPVEECDTDTFVAAVQQWLAGSPHTSIESARFSDLPKEGYWKTESGQESLDSLIARSGASDTAGFKHTISDQGLEWTTYVVYSRTQSDTWVGVRTARESAQPLVSMPQAKKPLVVRTLLQTLRGGLDGELFVKDEPYVLQDNDISMAARLINGDADNYLPIVYVSAGFNDSLEVNPEPLARVLGGMAHVVVEPNRAFSRRLQIEVESRNVYGGRVGVHWPNGTRQAYFLNAEMPAEFDVRRRLAFDLRSALLNRRPLARTSWANAEAQVARAAFERLKGEGSEKIEDYVRTFDLEMKLKNDELMQAEHEIQQLKIQLVAADAKHRQSSAIGIRARGEQEFYDGEFNEVVFDALEGALAQVQSGSRREHILSAILNSTKTTEFSKTQRDELKRLLREYTSMDKSIRIGLEKLGFTVTDDGKHHKLVYRSDPRYTFSLPKSGSDHRGGLNAVSDISKRLF